MEDAVAWQQQAVPFIGRAVFGASALGYLHPEGPELYVGEGGGCSLVTSPAELWKSPQKHQQLANSLLAGLDAGFRDGEATVAALARPASDPRSLKALPVLPGAETARNRFERWALAAGDGSRLAHLMTDAVDSSGNNLCHVMALTGAVEPLLIAMQSLREWRVQARMMERAAPLLIANGFLDLRFQEAKNPILGLLDIVEEQAAAASTAVLQAKICKDADAIQAKTTKVLDAAQRSATTRIEDMLLKAPLEVEERTAQAAARVSVAGPGGALAAVRELSAEGSMDSHDLCNMTTEAGPVASTQSHFPQMTVAIRNASGTSFKVPMAMLEAPSDDESDCGSSIGAKNPSSPGVPLASGGAPAPTVLTDMTAATKLGWEDVVGALDIDEYVAESSGSDSDSDSSDSASKPPRGPRSPRFWTEAATGVEVRTELQAAASVSAFFAASAVARAEAAAAQASTGRGSVISPREAGSETGSMLVAAADDASSIHSSVADDAAHAAAGGPAAGTVDREDLLGRILDWVEATQGHDDIAREFGNGSGSGQPSYPEHLLPELFHAALCPDSNAAGDADEPAQQGSDSPLARLTAAIAKALAKLSARPDPPTAGQVAAASAVLGQAEFATWVMSHHAEAWQSGADWSPAADAAAAEAGGAEAADAAAAEAGTEQQLGMGRWWAVGIDPAKEILGLASERGVTPLMMAAVGGSGGCAALVADLGPAFMTRARAAGRLAPTALGDIVAESQRAAAGKHVKAVVQALATDGPSEPPLAEPGQAVSPSKVAFGEAEETKEEFGGDSAGAAAGAGLVPEDSQPWLRDTETAFEKVLLGAEPTSLGPIPSSVFGRQATEPPALEGTDVTLNFSPPSTSLAEGRGLSPCHVAALLGNADALAALAARGAAIDAELPHSRATPLSLAASGLSGWGLRRLLFSRLNAHLLLLAERAHDEGDMTLSEAFKLKLALLDAGSAPSPDTRSGSVGRAAPLPSGAREVWDMPALPDPEAVSELLEARHERMEDMERRQAGLALAASAEMGFLEDVDSDVQKALDATWLASGPSKEQSGRTTRQEAARAARASAQAQSRKLFEQKQAKAEQRRKEMLLTKEDGARLLASQWVPARAEDEGVFVAGLMGVGADYATMPLREAAAQAAMEAVALASDEAVLPATEGGDWAMLRAALEAVACDLSLEGRREAAAGWPLPEDPADEDEEAEEEGDDDRDAADTDPSEAGAAASAKPSDQERETAALADALQGSARFAWMPKQMRCTAVSRLPALLQFCRERAWREWSRARAVAVLIRHGARVGGAPRAVATPLLLATLSGSVAVVATLAANGASLSPGDVSTPGSFAWAAAHAASPALLLLALRTADGGDICGSASLVAAARGRADDRKAAGAAEPAEEQLRFSEAVLRLRPCSASLAGLLPLLAAGVPARRCPADTDAVVLKAVDGRETLGEAAGAASGPGAGAEDEDFRDQAAGDATPDLEAPLLRQTASALLLCAGLPAGWPDMQGESVGLSGEAVAAAAWAGGLRTDPQSLVLLPLSLEEAEKRMKEVDDEADAEPGPPSQSDTAAVSGAGAGATGAAAVVGDPTDPAEEATAAAAPPASVSSATSGPAKAVPRAEAPSQAKAVAAATVASDAVLLAAANRLDGALALAAQVCRSDVQPTVLGAAGITVSSARAAADWCSEGVAGRVCFPAVDDVEALPGEAAPVPLQSQQWLDDASAPGHRFWLADPSFGFTPEGLREAVRGPAGPTGSAGPERGERQEALLKWVRSAWSVCPGEEMAEALHCAARRGSSGWLLALAPVAETVETRVVTARPFMPSDVVEGKALDIPAWFSDPQALPATQAVSLPEAAAQSPGMEGEALTVARLVAMAPGLVASLSDASRAAMWRDLVAAAAGRRAAQQATENDELAPPKGRSLCGGLSAPRAPYARLEGDPLAGAQQHRGCDVEACSVQ